MPKFLVFCDPATLEGEFEADDQDAAITEALNEWCPMLGEATDAICAGSFDVRQVPE